jgi:hypothetical protein
MASAAGIFLQAVGLGGTTVALAGCGHTSIESGVELVESYVQPENFVVPGVGVFYASTCTQCASACGIMGRVREGRILKLEGNPAVRDQRREDLRPRPGRRAAALQSRSPDDPADPGPRFVEADELGIKAMALLIASLRRCGGAHGPARMAHGSDERPPANPAAQPRRGGKRHRPSRLRSALDRGRDPAVNRKLYGVDSPVGPHRKGRARALIRR